MSRVFRIENPSTLRNRHMRSIAEMLRRLSQKPKLDTEGKDLAAKITLLLWEITDGVERSAQAWEKRDYWMKAERFMRDWTWAAEIAANMEDVLRHEALDLLPELMAELFPRLATIQIKSMTRKADLWRGAFAELMAQPPREYPW
jgi:hypothetical protein